MELNESGTFSELGLKSVGSIIGSYWICDGLSKLILILSIFLMGLVFGWSIGCSCKVAFGWSTGTFGGLMGDAGCGGDWTC